MTPRCINGVEYTKCLRESQRSTYIKRQGKNKAASNGFKCYKKKLFWFSSLDQVISINVQTQAEKCMQRCKNALRTPVHKSG